MSKIDLKELEATARDIGSTIGAVLPADVVFALILADAGAGGHVTYISNGHRSDMIKMLRELLGKIEEELH